ncbi:MAG: matrixin family metalloprotease [Myxococcota bacterium]
MIAVWLATLEAEAFDYLGGPCFTPTDYRLEPTAFTANQTAQIELGAAAWNAGVGHAIRGATFQITRGADVTSGAGGNFRNEVYEKNTAWFLSHGGSNTTLAANVSLPLVDVDIVFNSDVTWCNDTPSACASGDSIGQVTAHEFGHRMGFNHEDDNIAIMNSFYPDGGDMSNVKYRINEDDSVGLQAACPGPSTGVNLMLSKFGFTYNGTSEELWDNTTASWIYDLSDAVFRGAPTAPGVPPAILAIIEGTSPVNTTIEWRVELASGAACFDGVGTEYVVGTLTPGLAVNLPFTVAPSAWNFTGVPGGTYRLCAKINPSGSVTETSMLDNNVRSEAYLWVQP